MPSTAWVAESLSMVPVTLPPKHRDISDKGYSIGFSAIRFQWTVHTAVVWATTWVPWTAGVDGLDDDDDFDNSDKAVQVICLVMSTRLFFGLQLGGIKLGWNTW